MAQHLVVESMLALKADGLAVMLAKEVVGVDGRVVDTKESPAGLLLFGCDVLKLEALHLVEVLDGVARDTESLLIVFPAIEKLVFACTQDLAQFRHVERRIDTKPFEVTHLLSVHASHAGADDEVGLFLLAEFFKEGQGFRWVNGYVWCHYVCLRQVLAQQLHRAASS